MSLKIRNSFLLMVAALIWGTAFVAQSEGADAIGPYAFNCIRSFIGTGALLVVIFVLDKLGMSKKKPVTKEEKKLLLKGGISCGIVLFIAGNLQQVGLYYGTSAGKAGFLTACYILLVPIIGIFLKKKCGWNIWIGVGLTLIGLYLLCMSGSLSLQFSDGLVLICALFFAIQILIVDYYSPLVDGVRLSCIQFVVCAVLGLIPTCCVDIGLSQESLQAWLPLLASWDAWGSLLFAGVMSSGVAFTLQIIAQNGLNPTVASLIMSLESVFAVLAGWLILQERMTGREIMGCVLIFGAIVLAQIPMKRYSKN